MAASHESLWRNFNTCFEVGLEILRVMQENAERKGESKDTAVEKITDDVLLMSNDNEILIAISKDTAKAELSDAAISYGTEKGEYLCYSGAATAIPLHELSKVNAAVRDYIISDESLRATLYGNYPEYVKTYNMSAPPGDGVDDADAPPYLFLQKQLDHEADNARNEVSAFQETENANSHGAYNDYDPFDDECVLER